MADTPQPARLPPSVSEPLDAFFTDLVRAETRLYNAVSDRLEQAHGIGVGTWAFLRFVHEHPGCRVADIGAHFAVGIGATSKSVDRWVSRGWARRDPNPRDRRSSLVSLTDAGARVVADAHPTFERALAEFVSPVISPADLAVTQASLSRLRQHLADQDAGTPTG